LRKQHRNSARHPENAGQTFRTTKSLFATRPIFHKLDETIRGHVSCSFLALVLKKELEDCIADLSKSGSWPKIFADLDSLTETEVEQDNKRFFLRSAARPAASLALRAVGVALPSVGRTLIRTVTNHSKCSAKPRFPARISKCNQWLESTHCRRSTLTQQ
jgi:hypothetical protein